jgi:hypothetical protein
MKRVCGLGKNTVNCQAVLIKAIKLSFLKQVENIVSGEANIVVLKQPLFHGVSYVVPNE